jgi:penicillin amidase
MAKKPAPAWVKPAVLGGILLLVVILGGIRLGPLPPPGKFFNPFVGFWRNAEAGGLKGGTLRLDGLREPVSIAFDKRGVPHIFAQNTHDLYFAQGYITARDRLWQMEIQAHASAGRLAEILGPALVERDRFQRRLGIPAAAERNLETLKKDAESWEAAEAYAAGVNAHIGSLDPSRYPVEYKLLDYAPERWTPVKTLLMVKNMQWTLSGGGDDLPLTNTKGKFGSDFMRRFFPAFDPTVDPVIPAGTAWARAPDTASPPPPPALLPGDSTFRPDTSGAPHVVPVPEPAPPGPIPVLEHRPDPGNGSNNFVVSGRRTATGHPILANDPHLDLGLPSLWYEVQLAAPGLNAYGVSLPGAPGVVIGFNRSIAWGMTNGGDDVFDWYRVDFRDSTLTAYLYAGNWREARHVVEAIKVRGGGTVLDTVVHTHHGPVVLRTQERPSHRNSPSMHALRWQAHESSNELLAFLRIMKASSYEEFGEALRTFQCPAQNFIFASASGDIALDHHGLFPRKWKGQGRYTLVGSEPGHEWRDYLAPKDNPRVRNPEQGWLASANQHPADSTYPHFLGAGYMQGRRAVRLNQLVSEADSLTPEGAMSILLDGLNLHAAGILPEMLRRLDLAAVSQSDTAVAASLAAWDYRHDPGGLPPAAFDMWWSLLYRAIWKDEFGADSLRYQWPSKDRTRRLILEEPGEEWFDDITTPARETLDQLVNRTFNEACAALRRLGRSPTWSMYRPVQFRHLARLDAFSRLGVEAGGCADCVNALKSTHGPSWRMVVALGRQGPKAYGIYPGGQSGNPGSARYDEFIADWAQGRMHELLYLSDLRDRADQAPVRLLLEGK